MEDGLRPRSQPLLEQRFFPFKIVLIFHIHADETAVKFDAFRVAFLHAQPVLFSEIFERFATHIFLAALDFRLHIREILPVFDDPRRFLADKFQDKLQRHLFMRGDHDGHVGFDVKVDVFCVFPFEDKRNDRFAVCDLMLFHLDTPVNIVSMTCGISSGRSITNRYRLQPVLQSLLTYPVPYCWNAQRSLFTRFPFLGDENPSDRHRIMDYEN